MPMLVVMTQIQQSSALDTPEAAGSPSGMPSGVASTWALMVELSKPGIVKLVSLSAMMGYLLAVLESNWQLWPMLLTGAACLVGTSLCAAGANTFNQAAEWNRDALMGRTKGRPVPSGRLTPGGALIAGTVMTFVGAAVLIAGTNFAAATVALTTTAFYVLIYTPSKQLSSTSTIIGAVPGALPPVIGVAAGASGGMSDGWDGALNPVGWSIFVIMFIWQVPHFLAIAWKYRDEYAAAGFRVLPCVERGGARTSRAVLAWSLLLLPVSWLPAWSSDLLGWPSVVACMAASVVMIVPALSLARKRTDAAARKLFFASIIYLPVVLFALVGDAVITRVWG